MSRSFCLSCCRKSRCRRRSSLETAFHIPLVLAATITSTTMKPLILLFVLLSSRPAACIALDNNKHVAADVNLTKVNMNDNNDVM